MPIIFIIAMQIMMFVGHEVLLILSASILSLVVIVWFHVLSASKSYLKKKIKKALHNPEQEELFYSTIAGELQHTAQETFTDHKMCISVFVTLNWLILVTPNGCLICRLNEIQNISTDFEESRSRLKLRVDFFDGCSFLCAYEHIYEPIVELINKKESRGSTL